jgi:hypothetical protein
MSFAISPEPNKKNYIKPISVEDYKKQGTDFTQKALLELKEQMNTFTPKKHSIFKNPKIGPIIYDNDNDDDNDDDINNDNDNDNDNECNSETDYDLSDKEDKEDKHNIKNSNTNIKLIIQNVKSDSSKNKKDAKSSAKTSPKTSVKSSTEASAVTDAIYKHLDNDNNKIVILNNKIAELKSVCKKMDKDSHFLKLDLVNSQCDKDKLEKDITFYKKKIDFMDDLLKVEIENKRQEKEYLKYLKIFTIILLALNAYFEFFKYILLIIGIVFLYFRKYIS